MFARIQAFFQKLFKVGKAAQDVGTAAGSVQDIAKKRNIKDMAGAVVQASQDISSASGSIDDARK